MKAARAPVLIIVSLMLPLAAPAPANADQQTPPLPTGTSTMSVTSASCVAQLHAIDSSADKTVCEIIITNTVGPVQSASESAAGSGSIRFQDWTQTYYSGATWEIQKGRVYWDGTYVWEASHNGYAGNHTCHAPGSISVGLAISNVRNCNDPGAASAVSFTETFDWAFVVKGSGLQGVCEMHSRYTKSGVHTASLSGSC